MTMPFYASAEQIMRDRSEYARKGIARGRRVVVLTYADGVLFVAENASSALHKVSEIYDRIAFAARRQVQRVREPARRRHPPGRPARLLLRPSRRHRAGARQRVCPDAGHDLHRAAKALRGRDLRRRGRRPRPTTTRCTALSYDGTIVDEPDFLVMGGQAEALTTEMRRTYQRGPHARRCARRSRRRAGLGRRQRQPAHAARQPTRGRRARPHPRQAQVPADHRRGADRLLPAGTGVRPASRHRPTRRRHDSA